MVKLYFTPDVDKPYTWANISTSLCHSTIVGLLSIFAFIEEPEMWHDMLRRKSRILEGFLIGFFVGVSILILIMNVRCLV